ncbi:MAG: S-layer protein [Candidatus Aenigmatarchaeota archaeon]
MKEKIIASLMAALTALTTVYPALAVTLADFPGFLGKPVEDFLIVIGAAAKPEDVVGAADVAIALAVQSTEEVAVPGVSAAVEGKEQSVALGSSISVETYTKTQVPLLKRETIEYEDQSAMLIEKITLPGAKVKHDDELNGTIYVDLTGKKLIYTVTFTKELNLAGSINKALKLKLFGQEFSIVETTKGQTLNSIKILTGVTGSIDGTTGLTYGEYTIYSDIGAADGSWIRVKIMKGDSTVDTLYVSKTSPATSSATGLEVRLIDAWVSADNVVLRADVVVGPKGKTLKEYKEGDAFPTNDYWTFDTIKLSDNNKLEEISLIYNINETNQYLKAGEKAIVPNNYFEFGFKELAVKEYVTLTFEAGKTSGGIYDSTNVETKIAGELPAIVITADKPVFGGEVYKKAYIAFNTSHVAEAYYDESLGKIVGTVLSASTKDAEIDGTFDKHDFTITFDDENNVTIVDTSDTGTINLAYKLSDDGKKFQLGNKTGEAEDADVCIDEEGDGNCNVNLGTQEWKETLDYGTEILGIKEYTARDKVVMKLPADQQKAVVYVGKLGAAVEGQTYLKYTPVTAPVAKLDTELSAADKTKNLVVVGGPCVNQEAAAALGLTFPACGEASGIPENAAIIKIVEDYPASGKYTVIVAGWEAANTRTACAVVQQYATLLKDQNVKAIKVTAATTTGITPM